MIHCTICHSRVDDPSITFFAEPSDIYCSHWKLRKSCKAEPPRIPLLPRSHAAIPAAAAKPLPPLLLLPPISISLFIFRNCYSQKANRDDVKFSAKKSVFSLSLRWRRFRWHLMDKQCGRFCLVPGKEPLFRSSKPDVRWENTPIRQVFLPAKTKRATTLVTFGDSSPRISRVG